MVFSKLILSSRLVKAYLAILFFLEKYIGAFLFLTIRIWMAQIFWDSGVCKFQSWPSTLMLFKYEYKVPVISPDLAAYLATITELTCPVLLAIGLASRLAVVPMLIVTAVIQCTYLCLNEHLYWAMLLGLILCYGPGQISFDFLFRKWALRKEAP